MMVPLVTVFVSVGALVGLAMWYWSYEGRKRLEARIDDTSRDVARMVLDIRHLQLGAGEAHTEPFDAGDEWTVLDTAVSGNGNGDVCPDCGTACMGDWHQINDDVASLCGLLREFAVAVDHAACVGLFGHRTKQQNGAARDLRRLAARARATVDQIPGEG